jgi:hypothetical protein
MNETATSQTGCLLVGYSSAQPVNTTVSPTRGPYFFFQVAPQLYSRGWMNPVPDPLLLKKLESNPGLWICSQKRWPLDHRGCRRPGVCFPFTLSSAKAKAKRWTTGFDSRDWQETFIFSTASRPTQGPTLPPVQYVPRAISQAVNRPASEAGH